MANKNIRIKGRFISNEMQKAVNSLSKSAGISVQEFAEENKELLYKLNNGGGNILAKSNIENIERNFQNYNKKDYEFVDRVTGEKLFYSDVIEAASEYGNLKGTKSEGGLIWAQFQYFINIANKEILIDFEQIMAFIQAIKGGDFDAIDEDYFDDIEFAIYEEQNG